jgi:hypothetical protein
MDNCPEPASPLQPGTEPLTDPPAETEPLSDPSDEPESGPRYSPEHAERLRKDRELVDVLAAADFSGPVYAVFEEEMAAYGLHLVTRDTAKS